MKKTILTQAITICCLITILGSLSPLKAKCQSNGPVSIDADQMYPMHDGLAIIRKGTSFAVIDLAGNIVIPYNKFIFDPLAVFKNGYCVAASVNGLEGVINSNGKIVIPLEYRSISYFDNEGWALAIEMNTNKHIFVNGHSKIPVAAPFILPINSNGSMLSGNGGLKQLFDGHVGSKGGIDIEHDDYQFVDGISRGRSNGLYGYYDRNGNQIIAPKYIDASIFSEGLACVAKKDQFGELKYGYIDTKGNTIIPFQFTKKPGDFSSGLAYVEPVKQDKYQFAFIDKTGNVLLKQTEGTPLMIEKSKSKFEGGVFRFVVPRKGLTIIDKTGNETKGSLALAGLSYVSFAMPGNQQLYNVVDGVGRFQYRTAKGYFAVGYIDYNSGFILKTECSYAEDFDKLSGLALVYDEKTYFFIDKNGVVKIRNTPNKSEF